MSCPVLHPYLASDGSLLADGKEPMVCELEDGHDAVGGSPNWHIRTLPGDEASAAGYVIHWGAEDDG